MRIMQIMHYPGQGGAEQYAYLLAKNALKSGDQVLFVFGQQGPLVERAEKLGCEVQFLIMKSPFDVVSTLALQKIIKKWQPEIIHTHFLRENFLAIVASKGTGVKAVFSTVHRVEPKTLAQATFNRLYSKGLTKFIAVSELVKEYLAKEKIPESKIVVIPLGVEFEEHSRATVRKKYAFGKEKIICSVGRFSEEKGLDELIAAFASLKIANSKLVIVGGGKLEKSFKETTKKLKINDQVTLITGNQNSREIVAGCDLYIQPSRVETFGLAAVEAMSLKIPVILSDIPIFRKLAGEEEGRGLLYKPGNKNDLARKMRIALEDKKASDKRAKQAYEYVNSRYRDGDMWENTRRLYEKYCEKC